MDWRDFAVIFAVGFCLKQDIGLLEPAKGFTRVGEVHGWKRACFGLSGVGECVGERRW